MIFIANSVDQVVLPVNKEMCYHFDTSKNEKNSKNILISFDKVLTLDTLNEKFIDFNASLKSIDKSVLEFSSKSFASEWDREDDDYWNQYL